MFNKYIGIPYKDKGRDFNGCDCWGIVQLIFKYELNIILPSYTENYASVAELKEIELLIKDQIVNWMPIDKVKPFDIVIMNIMGSPVHTGLIINKTQMIHTLPGHNSVCNKYDDPRWKKRIQGFYRYKEILSGKQ